MAFRTMIRALPVLILATLLCIPLSRATDAPRLKLEPDDAVRLQIFLDENHHGPGVIDGKPGRFTTLALAAWNEANGHPHDDLEAVLNAAREQVKYPFATAIVPDAAKDWVDPELPLDRPGQAAKKRMSYRSMVEFLAERYHCDEDYLRALNVGTKLDTLKPGDSLTVPNVLPFQIEKISGSSHKEDPELSPRHVVVDTRTNQLRIYKQAPAALVVAEPGQPVAVNTVIRNHGLIASFPITPGRAQFIAFGTWDLRNMIEMPWWRYDQHFLDTGERGPDDQALNIPPGPNSPVGIIWNGTSKAGIGLHGTDSPETIGRARSAGCIRLCNWDAARLPQFIRPGTSIEIR